MKTITIAGKLGRDAETRTAGNDSVTSFSVAVDEKKGGEKTTYWFDCSIWGRRGEALAQYLTKGSSVAIAGEFSTRQYQTKDGETKTSLSVRVDQITLQGGRQQDGGGQGGGQGYQGGDQRQQVGGGHQQRRDDNRYAAEDARRQYDGTQDFGEDDIPF